MNLLDISTPEARILPLLLQQQAKESPDADFLIRGDKHITFAQADAPPASP